MPEPDVDVLAEHEAVGHRDLALLWGCTPEEAADRVIASRTILSSPANWDPQHPDYTADGVTPTLDTDPA